MKKNIVIVIPFILILSIGILWFIRPKMIKMDHFVGKNVDEIKNFALKNNLKLELTEQYSKEEKGIIISQNIDSDKKIKKGSTIKAEISIGFTKEEQYASKSVNEAGDIPIMMYHGVHHMKNEETKYTGGNIDYDGYQRTTEAFKNDLEFYYQEGYRMIALKDYIEGKIDVELGYSPIILTFDDGASNNFKVTGIDENGELIIDKECAVGILESFKKKYPDFQVTATFFLNASLFGQPEYNEKIINWLIKHNYDIGNHTLNHPDFTKIDKEKASQEVGGMYRILEDLTEQFIPVVALPFGSPYDLEHDNFDSIIHSVYENKNYETKATLRVGWESESSPFVKDFNPLFLKRIRAYDHSGTEFDIKMNFEILKKTRYISDGDINTVVIPKEEKENIKSNMKEAIIY